MDNAAKEIARKIISELEAIKRLLVRPITDPEKKTECRDEYKHQAEKRDDNPHYRRESSAPKSNTSISADNTTAREKSERFPKLTQWKPVIEVAGLIALVIYTGVTIFVARESNRANNIASDALRLSRDNFRQDQRPYIWLTGDLGSPRFIPPLVQPESIVGQVIWTFHFTNYGKTPAYNIRYQKYIKMGDRQPILSMDSTTHLLVRRCRPIRTILIP